MDSLDREVSRFIKSNHLCNESDRLLLAVSGGVDSMVLAHILLEANFDIGIAHYNFMLRKKASKKDESFVETYAQIWQVPFFSTRFDTLAHVKKYKLNLQEAARNLRYSWFSKIMEKHNYNLLVTAHHQDDQIETVMLNIARGAGIFGLQGMAPKRAHIIRPLLFASKEEILQYAKEKSILFRTDKSNRNQKYRRNYLRHGLIPNIEKELPSFKKRMAENIAIWQRSAQLLGGFITQQIGEHKKLRGDSILLDVDKIEESLRDLVTFEWLRPYGFNYTQVKQMISCLDENTSGKEFYSRLNRVVVDRKKLILSTLPRNMDEEITINNPDDVVHLPEGRLTIKLLSAPPDDFAPSSDEVHLDAQKIKFPLTLRRWAPGDYFYPFGMKGKKQKLKKYFVNQKIDRIQKEHVWLLCQEEDICWVVDHRLDERFRVSSDTKYVLRMNWHASE